MSLLLAGLAALVTVGVLWRLADHDLDRHQQEPFNVSVAGQSLAGTLWLPQRAPSAAPTAAPLAAIVLVHGDGPQDRTSGGGYAPFINALLDRGIAVASWDKPGVGESGGNWLHQSMADRAEETRAALALLDDRFNDVATGALGFSQAGWVLPALGSDDVDFMVLVGPAVSWQAQGRYFGEVRMRRQGLTPEAIARALAEDEQANARAFAVTATPADRPGGLSEDRWRFIRQNRNADARAMLAQLEVPLLALWGADDVNVNASEDAVIYESLVGTPHGDTRIMIWPDATHGLLRSGPYNWQLTSQWSSFAKLRFLLEGRQAFAPGSLDAITDWIIARAETAPAGR